MTNLNKKEKISVNETELPSPNTVSHKNETHAINFKNTTHIQPEVSTSLNNVKIENSTSKASNN